MVCNHVIVGKNPDDLARAVCQWLDEWRVDLVSVSQVVFGDVIYTTIFYTPRPSREADK